jgi:hypothetical protein
MCYNYICEIRVEVDAKIIKFYEAFKFIAKAVRMISEIILNRLNCGSIVF